MIEDPITICVAFLVEITLPVSTVNLEKLEKGRFKFITKNDYCDITIKGSNDTGADETLISQNLSNCLIMKDTPIKIRSILGETPGGKNIKITTAFIKNIE